MYIKERVPPETKISLFFKCPSDNVIINFVLIKKKRVIVHTCNVSEAGFGKQMSDCTHHHGVATIVQGTIVQGDGCPRDFCPMSQLSKENIVQ